MHRPASMIPPVSSTTSFALFPNKMAFCFRTKAYLVLILLFAVTMLTYNLMRISQDQQPSEDNERSFPANPGKAVQDSPEGPVGVPQAQARSVRDPEARGGSSVVDCVTGDVLRRYDPFRRVSFSEMVRESKIPVRENHSIRAASFRAIYRQQTWNGGPVGNATRLRARGQQSSGPGSFLAMTRNVRRTLATVVESAKKMLNKSVITLLDVPCGDFLWMEKFMSGRKDVLYTGMDIVPELITVLRAAPLNASKYLTFVQHDVAAKPLSSSYDLIFTRHMTQHLTNYDTMQILKHFSESGSSFLLATVVYYFDHNIELNPKDQFRFRPQNLELPPMSLVPPLCVAKDGELDYNALWRLPLYSVPNCSEKSRLMTAKNHFSCV